MRHVTRHVERLLYAFEEHYCGRCGMHCSSHGLYIIHPCEGPAEWPVAIPERVLYDGDGEREAWRWQQQVVPMRHEPLPLIDPSVLAEWEFDGGRWGRLSLLPSLHAALRLDRISEELRSMIIAGPNGIES